MIMGSKLLWGTALGDNFENLLQLTPFSVYLEGILNKHDGYFYMEMMILIAHMLEAFR